MFIGELISTVSAIFGLIRDAKERSINISLHDPAIRLFMDNTSSMVRIDVTVENGSSSQIVISSASVSLDKSKFYEALRRCPIQWNSHFVQYHDAGPLLVSPSDHVVLLPAAIPPNDLRRIVIWLHLPGKDEFQARLLEAMYKADPHARIAVAECMEDNPCTRSSQPPRNKSASTSPAQGLTDQTVQGTPLPTSGSGFFCCRSCLRVRREKVVKIAIKQLAKPSALFHKEIPALHLVFVSLSTYSKMISNLLICHIPTSLFRLEIWKHRLTSSLPFC